MITDVYFENENIRITLKNDGTWEMDMWSSSQTQKSAIMTTW